MCRDVEFEAREGSGSYQLLIIDRHYFILLPKILEDLCDHFDRQIVS